MTFFKKVSADRAMEQLHDKKTLQGVRSTAWTSTHIIVVQSPLLVPHTLVYSWAS